ncbi:glycosyltransferase [Thiomonas intermedia]|uniref:glycosyltransferase n=1 Tax=Thiomonas intermedia TaxID=926 RepID=UPI0009A5442E|nr:glycosyltransferase [Thiomonas intermedia]
MANEISIIILTYNRSDALNAVLNALAQQETIPSEVVITDDGSNASHTQITQSFLHSQEWPFRIKYIWHPDIGFTASTARNQGVLNSGGNYLIFLDGDCIPRHDFVSQHVHQRRQGCFINGSRILLDQDITEEIIRRPELVQNSILFWMKQRFFRRINKWIPMVARIPPFLRHASPHFKWSGIRSCNFSLWRDDFFKVNGFDEAFVGWGHEDADFVWRLQRAGLKRINGYWSTEVFHLWHFEASRDRESANARRLGERMTNPTSSYKAEQGLLEGSSHRSEILFSV